LDTALPASRAFTPEAVSRRDLDNGLTVLVLPDDAVPSLAYFTCWRVGSRNERPGITGISHLFEHLMFSGARKHGPREFDRIIESNGGTSNAYTTHDVTSYHEVMPSDRLSVVLDLELDRMRDLELSERTLASEREVVKEERRLRTDESPLGALYEQLYAVSYVAHPYRWPVIGWMPDIDALTVADLEDYFRTHYSPDNAVVAVAGAVDAPRALDEVSQALSVLPRGRARPPVVRSEPEQRGERRALLRVNAQLPAFLLAFHVGDSRSADLPALDVLQTILADGDSSRLQRALVLEQQLALDVNVDYPWMLDPGLFSLSLSVRPGVEPAAAEAALHAQLEAVATQPVGAHELRRAKAQLQADFHRRLKTSEGRADLLCTSEVILGDWAALFDMPRRYGAVTAEDVQRVAAAAFRADNRTVAVLDPLPAGDGEGGHD
jgi:predicted Zn-dependent peptidase